MEEICVAKHSNCFMSGQAFPAIVFIFVCSFFSMHCPASLYRIKETDFVFIIVTMKVLRLALNFWW